MQAWFTHRGALSSGQYCCESVESKTVSNYKSVLLVAPRASRKCLPRNSLLAGTMLGTVFGFCALVTPESARAGCAYTPGLTDTYFCTGSDPVISITAINDSNVIFSNQAVTTSGAHIDGRTNGWNIDFNQINVLGTTPVPVPDIVNTPFGVGTGAAGLSITSGDGNSITLVTSAANPTIGHVPGNYATIRSSYDAGIDLVIFGAGTITATLNGDIVA